MILGTLVGSAASGAGLMAAGIAVCGFLAHAKPAIAGKDDAALHHATVIGGLVGFVIAVGLIVLSSMV